MPTNNFAFMSRKIIVSVEIIAIATVFLFFARIFPSEWGILFSGILLSYLSGRTIDSNKTGKVKIGLKQRKEALFTREFVISLTAIAMTSGFVFMRNSEGYPLIDGTTWVQVNTTIGGFYNIFNPLQKQGYRHFNNLHTQEPNDEQSA